MITKFHLKKFQIALGAALLVLIVFGFVRYYSLSKENVRLASALAAAQTDLDASTHREGDLTDALNNAQASLADLNSQVDNISSTVGTLKKLTETDPELLKKYSKVYFLNENYVPKGLSDIDKKYLSDPSRQIQFLTQAEPFLYSLIDAGTTDGVHLLVASAYRSFATQGTLKSSYDVTYGSGTANSFSAEQGYSEHQLGTALDFTTAKIGGGLTGFDKTPEYAWLMANAYKYGFILSYPADNAYYIYEPWHWRFVGTALALRLHEEHENFYDLDQRQIDPYIVTLFEQ